MIQALCILTWATATSAVPVPPSPAGPTADEARAFVTKTNEELRKLWTRQSTAEWIKTTYITDDTERNAASCDEDVLEYMSRAVKEAARFKGLKVDPDTDRMLHLLRVGQVLPAPNDAAKRSELAALKAQLEGLYGKGKYVGKDEKKHDLLEASAVLAKSDKYDELLEAWEGWHSISKDMRPLYERVVTLANEGTREIAFKDTGDMWRSAYDMPPEAFEKETNRLWEQLKPLYDDLHCYVRNALAKKYGVDKVPLNKPMPAHLLGNMWAQDWSNVYGLVEPYKGQGNLDVTSALKAQKYDEMKMVKLAESFFTSIGLQPLPKTFWERSQFKKPADRDVVCHASAWDVTFSNDLRIKMCIKVDEEDLITLHHELGHNYYYMQYYGLPVLFQQGANDGFHEAIGDALTLSITPDYLKKLGLIDSVPKDDKGLINVQMKDALEKISFLPFGLVVDQWRWAVFSGKVKPSEYNKAWWDMRKKYQGVAPVNSRG